jgi:hypothetical protein
MFNQMTENFLVKTMNKQTLIVNQFCWRELKQQIILVSDKNLFTFHKEIIRLHQVTIINQNLETQISAKVKKNQLSPKKESLQEQNLLLELT